MNTPCQLRCRVKKQKSQVARRAQESLRRIGTWNLFALKKLTRLGERRALCRRLQKWERLAVARQPSFPLYTYLISALPPASVICLRMASASAFEIPSLTGFGAPSTR